MIDGKTTLIASVMIAALLQACQSRDTTSPPPPPYTGPLVRIAPGANVSDTAHAYLADPLTIEVRDTTGKPRQGVAVQFTAVPGRDSVGEIAPVIAITSIRGQDWFAFVSDSTDAAGQVRARVQFRGVAGPARIAVSVPTLGFSDTADYTVRPGAAARMIFAFPDTAITVGSSYTPNAASIDRSGNRRADTITYFTVSPTCNVDAAGRITGTRIGRCSVAARVGIVHDSARATVVPEGAFIALHVPDTGTPSVMIVALDGSTRQPIATLAVSQVYQIYPNASVGGSRAAFQDINRLFVVENGVRRRVLGGSPFTWEGMPRFSRDGAWIYFTAMNGITRTVHRVRPNGADLERLPIAGVSNTTEPDPSPDGKRVVLVADGRIHIHTLGVRDSMLAPSGPLGALPRWSPTGDRIAFLNGNQVHVVNADGTNLQSIPPRLPNRYQNSAGLDWWDERLLLVRGGRFIEIIDVASKEAWVLGYSERLYQAAALR